MLRIRSAAFGLQKDWNKPLGFSGTRRRFWNCCSLKAALPLTSD